MSTNNLFSNEKRGNARNVIAVLDKIKKETIKYADISFLKMPRISGIWSKVCREYLSSSIEVAAILYFMAVSMCLDEFLECFLRLLKKHNAP